VFINIPICAEPYLQTGAQYTQLSYDYRQFKTSPNVMLLPGHTCRVFFALIFLLFTAALFP
jgi:hypothetical protein